MKNYTNRSTFGTLKGVLKTTLVAILCLVIILMSAFFSARSVASALTNAPKVNDYAGLMSGGEADLLNNYLGELSEKLQFDVVILTVDDTGSRTAAQYADDFYDSNGYGYGEFYDGCILIVDMGGSTFDMTTCGNGIYYISDSDYNEILDTVCDYIVSDDPEYSWYEVFRYGYADTLEPIVEDSLAYYGDSNPYANFEEDYVPDTPSNSSQSSEPNWFGGIGASVVVGAIAGFSSSNKQKRKLKTVHTKVEANQYVAPGGLNLLVSQDRYLYSNVSVSPKPKDNGGLGGGTGHVSTHHGTSTVHHSSSGRAHGGGGGGRHF